MFFKKKKDLVELDERKINERLTEIKKELIDFKAFCDKTFLEYQEEIERLLLKQHCLDCIYFHPEHIDKNGKTGYCYRDAPCNDFERGRLAYFDTINIFMRSENCEKHITGDYCKGCEYLKQNCCVFDIQKEYAKIKFLGEI